MTHRERIKKVLNGEIPDRVPYSFKLVPAQIDVCEKMTGTRDYVEYFDFDVRQAGPCKTKLKTDFTQFHDDIPENSWFNDWGVLFEGRDSYHFARRHHPMAKFDSIEQIESYPFPDFDQEYRYEHLAAEGERVHNGGYAFGCGFGLGPIQTTWNLRGIDNFMVDAVINEKFIRVLFDRVVDILCARARFQANAHPDIMFSGDNCATQRGLMVSRQFWRDWYGEAHKKIIQAIKEVDPNIKYYYHADGMVQELIPDMIEVGMDIFDPVQPECMDPAEIKDLYRGQILLSGAISIQKTMPFGTPEDVNAEVKLRMETIGKGGGYFMAPTHFIEPEVPWGNVMALVNAAKKYGRYE